MASRPQVYRRDSPARSIDALDPAAAAANTGQPSGILAIAAGTARQLEADTDIIAFASSPLRARLLQCQRDRSSCSARTPTLTSSIDAD